MVLMALMVANGANGVIVLMDCNGLLMVLLTKRYFMDMYGYGHR
jgi:hypothetical protein